MAQEPDPKPGWITNGAVLEYREELRTREDRSSAATVEHVDWKLLVLKFDAKYILEVDRIGASAEAGAKAKRREFNLEPARYWPNTDDEKIRWMVGNFDIEQGEAVTIEGLPGLYTVVKDVAEVGGLERGCWYCTRNRSRFMPEDASAEFWFDRAYGILLHCVEVVPRGFTSIELTNIDI